jgi:seryl-tRNA(Sec) selenium transferase
MKNRNNVMTFNKFISYFKLDESLKEIRLNQILDKISNKTKLSKSEQDFLDHYDETSEEDMMDLRMLSKESTFTKISQLLERGKKVICNLVDKDGKIGIQILQIYNKFDDETSIMTLKNGEKIKLMDNILYNIIYNTNKDEFSLEMEDEFFEKLPIKND